MSAFKQSTRKLGLRAGLLAGASAAVLAISGLSAGSAMAAPTCPEGARITGMGSSLQKAAQEIWTGHEVLNVTEPKQIPNQGNTNGKANSYFAKCGTKAQVTYGSSGSGKGLNAFGYNGGALTLGPNEELGFIGSDDGPSPTQIANAKTASGVEPVILPVSQTAIAIMVNPPAECEVEVLSWNDLNRAFGGSKTGGTGIKFWNEFSEAEGPGCAGNEVTRVVRAEGSGTTLQLKNYLQTQATTAGIGAEQLPCMIGEKGEEVAENGATEWSQLEEVGTNEERPNITWPKCPGSTPVITAAGGGEVAKTVDLTDGTIGYAALPDAEAHLTTGASLAQLQNGGTTGTPAFAEAANTSNSTARCVKARYEVPTNGIRGSGHTGLAVNWSTVFGAQPKIGGPEYPLCTLTYIAGWNNYTEADYGAGHALTGSAVKDYVQQYIVGEGGTAGEGQAAIVGHWYSAMPLGAGKETNTNVQESAEFIAEKLG